MEINYVNITIAKEFKKFQEGIEKLMPHLKSISKLSSLLTKNDNPIVNYKHNTGGYAVIGSIDNTIQTTRMLVQAMSNYLEDQGYIDDLENYLPDISNIPTLSYVYTYHKHIMETKYNPNEYDTTSNLYLLNIITNIEKIFLLFSLNVENINEGLNEGIDETTSDEINIRMKSFLMFSLDNIALVCEYVEKLVKEIG